MRNADARNIQPMRGAPIPSVMAFSRVCKKLALTMKEAWGGLYRLAYGYIGGIKSLHKDDERDLIGAISLNSMGHFFILPPPTRLYYRL